MKDLEAKRAANATKSTKVFYLVKVKVSAPVQLSPLRLEVPSKMSIWETQDRIFCHAAAVRPACKYCCLTI